MTEALPAAEAERDATSEDTPGTVDPAAIDRRIAHVLLRSGNPLPARVHLETLAGRGALDSPGFLDLAESRWRMGDTTGAGEAAAAYLEAGGSDALAYLIAAEASAARGRPGEARRLAKQALEGLSVSLDAVFAGQLRSGIWPHDPAAPAQPAGTLFSPAAAEPSRGGRIGLTQDHGRTAGAAAATGGASSAPAADGAVEEPPQSPTGAQPSMALEVQPDRSLWEAASDDAKPDVQGELDAARAALASGDTRVAVVRLGIVLRLRPGLAPVILDVVGDLPGADLDLLRGDALRLVGREAAAEQAFAAAADALREPPPTRSPE